MGHSGQKIEADKITVALFIATGVIVVTRILASLFFIGEHNMWIGFTHLSFLLWLVLFVVWGIRYGKTLTKYDALLK